MDLILDVNIQIYPVDLGECDCRSAILVARATCEGEVEAQVAGGVVAGNMCGTDH